ncbi:hypothetical protein [Roseimaritima sediminicola]|uniref:hypothetical protein n=1 Tax=Roseimaritima sediminicola TaxID=2662066 RepID=UPI00129856B5|nr:hypothetical protein [Roseimaritima sediminicola]
MTNSQRLAAVREHLRAWYDRQANAQPWEATESILVREGFYCGRTFRFADHRAVWFVEEEEVKIYAADGSLLEVFSTENLTEPAPSVKLFQSDAEEESAAADEVAETPRETVDDQPSRRAA